MNDWTASQIRELVNVEIKAERRLRDALRFEDQEAFKEYKRTVVEKLRVEVEENKRDRTELERRLTVLNHAHEDAQKKEVTFVKTTVFEEFLKGFHERVKKLEEDYTERGARSKTLMATVGFLSTAAFLISVAVAVLTYAR